jgi:atlastin
LTLIEEKERNSSMSAKPLQILGADDGGTELRLRRRHLESILLHPKAKDRPVAIVSVCGDLRKGKSFLLNVLLRYFAWAEKHPERAAELVRDRNQSSETRPSDVAAPEWLGDSAEPLTGFGWRAGSNRMTTGIWMWSEPFVVPSQAFQVRSIHFNMLILNAAH